MTHEAKPTPDLRKRAEELAGRHEGHRRQYDSSCASIAGYDCDCPRAERVAGIEKLLEHQDWPLLLAAPLQKYQEQDPNAAEFAGEAIRVVRERIEAARSEGRKAGLEEAIKTLKDFGEEAHNDHIIAMENGSNQQHYQWLRGRCQGVDDSEEKVRALAGKETE